MLQFRFFCAVRTLIEQMVVSETPLNKDFASPTFYVIFYVMPHICNSQS